MGKNLFKEKCFSNRGLAFSFTSLMSGGQFSIKGGQPANYWSGIGSGSNYKVRLSYQICRAMLEYLSGINISIGKTVSNKNYHIEVKGTKYYYVMRMDESIKKVRYIAVDENQNLIAEDSAKELVLPNGKTYCHWAAILPFIISKQYVQNPRIAQMKTTMVLNNKVEDADIYWFNDVIYQEGKVADTFANEEDFIYDADLYQKSVEEITDETSLHGAMSSNGKFLFGLINGKVSTPDPQISIQTSVANNTSAKSKTITCNLPTEAEFRKNIEQYRLVNEFEISDEDKDLIPHYNLSQMKYSTHFIDVVDCVKERFSWGTDQLWKFLFFGETGAGKSTMAELLAQILGLPYDFSNFNFNSEESDLVGEYLPDGNGGWILCSPSFIERYTKGGVIELVEFDYAKQGTLGFLNSALDDKQSIKLKSGKTIRRHPNCVIVATMNLDYEGCQELNLSLKNRFQEFLEIEKLTDSDLVDLIELFTRDNTQRPLYEKMVKASHKIEEHMKENAINGVITLRTLREWAWKSIRRGNPLEAAETTLLPGISFGKEERDSIRDSILKTTF